MAPSTEAAQCVCVVKTTRRAGHKITHSFLADLPHTITYHARAGRDHAANLAGGQGIQAGGRARTDAGHDIRVRHIHAGQSRPTARHVVLTVPRTDEGSAAGDWACTEAGHGVVKVPRREERPAADSPRLAFPWSSPAGRAVRRWPFHGGKPSTIAMMMADCPVIYYDEEELVVLRLLRWSATALALFVAGICGRRDEPDVCCQDDGPVNLWFEGRVNPHVSRAPYFPTP